MENKKQPPVLAAQKQKQKYHKPSFEVIDLDITLPLLSGSNIGKKAPITPIKPGNSW